jgi:hypothetical protein
VAGAPGGFGDELQPQRLEPQVDLRVHQRAGMNHEEFHEVLIGGGLSAGIERPLGYALAAL